MQNANLIKFRVQTCQYLFIYLFCVNYLPESLSRELSSKNLRTRVVGKGGKWRWRRSIFHNKLKWLSEEPTNHRGLPSSPLLLQEFSPESHPLLPLLFRSSFYLHFPFSYSSFIQGIPSKMNRNTPIFPESLFSIRYSVFHFLQINIVLVIWRTGFYFSRWYTCRLVAVVEFWNYSFVLWSLQFLEVGHCVRNFVCIN